MWSGDPLPEEITLTAAEARVVYTCPTSQNSARSSMGSMGEELLTLPAVARQLRITVDEALSLIESGELRAGRGTDGGLYVRPGELESYRAAHAS